MDANILLEYEDIEKVFFGVRVLSKVRFALREGHILGLVGENGAGKSTLVNILGGVIRADAGRIRFRGRDYVAARPADAFRQGIAFIHQELNLFTNLDVAENIFVAGFPARRIAGIPWVDAKTMRTRARELLDSVGLRIPCDTLVERLSQGERQLVEIAKALSLDARLIILDEPTTSLTTRESERLFALMGQLRARGISMIYISHNLGDVFRLCDDIVVLRDGRVMDSGPAERFTEDRVISLMVGRSLEQYFPPRARGPAGEVALEVSGVSQPGIVEDIRFTLHRGEVLGISGLMGAGRSELARILFGLDPCARGEIAVNGVRIVPGAPGASIRTGMAFLTENRREEGLLMEASVADNIALVCLPSFAGAHSGLLNLASLGGEISRAASTLGIRSVSLARQKARTLSGGNQQKVVLAKWLLAGPSVFILDEPTRGIDVGAKHEVYKIINDVAEKGAGVIFISSEIEELMGMCDRILVMSAGEVTACVERADFDREQILRFALGRNPL
jgi:ribose transport system ATP-binding protein